MPRGASSHDIRRAFLKKAKELHPDKSNSPNSHAAFQQLQSAYKELKSPRRQDAQQAAKMGKPHHPFPGSFHSRHGFHRGTYTQYSNKAPPSKSTFELLWERRAWVRGGLVHRSLSRFTVNVLGCWPIWLLFTLAFLTGGRSRSGLLQYNSEGHAYVKQFGQYRRVPQYDDIPD